MFEPLSFLRPVTNQLGLVEKATPSRDKLIIKPFLRSYLMLISERKQSRTVWIRPRTPLFLRDRTANVVVYARVKYKLQFDENISVRIFEQRKIEKRRRPENRTRMRDNAWAMKRETDQRSFFVDLFFSSFLFTSLFSFFSSEIFFSARRLHFIFRSAVPCQSAHQLRNGFYSCLTLSPPLGELKEYLFEKKNHLK